MLEAAETGHAISRARFAREAPRLREALLNAQYDLAQSGRGPVIVIVSGVEGAGRHETANQLNAWMDPRHIHVRAFGDPTPEEAAHPPPWRYWNALPAAGTIGVMMPAWYHEPRDGRATGVLGDTAYDDALQRIRAHETMLCASGVVLLKFWMHLSRPALKERLATLRDEPEDAWRVTAEDRRTLKHYRRWRDDWEHLLRVTSSAVAPWYLVEGVDRHYREITVGTLLLDALRRVAGDEKRPEPAQPAPIPAALGNVEVIRSLDMQKRLAKSAYDDELARWQSALARLTGHKRFARHALVLAFEGADAAGKGGAIRRVTGALDARQYATVPIAAPSDEDRAHPYLWRFWRQVPRKGRITTIFDRTWYGRVLVERVEGLCPPDAWLRAYDEINQFEDELTDAGVVVCKFWLQISRDEQLARFHERERTPFKRFKITPDDWRNRKRWRDYEHAAADMVERTSTERVPWTLVEAQDKRYARVKVLRTICEELQRVLDR